MSDPAQPRLFPFPMSTGMPPTDHRDLIIREVQQGLRNERDRIADAVENQAYADLQGEMYIQRREAETEFDYAGRIKRVTGLTHQAVNRLTEHTYNPGPMRTVAGDLAAEELLGRVYRHCHIDGVMCEAERLATINDVACIQVGVPADPGRRARCPIDLQVWGSEEFAVFLHPDDQREPVAVCILDRVDEQTRYRLWFADLVYTFATKKLATDDTSGGVIAFQQGDPEPNVYGILPFAFVHYRSPVRQFWTSGVGTFLRHAEGVLNGQVSELAESIQKYGKPIGCFVDVSPEMNPEVGPGRFLRLLRGGSTYTGEGFEGGGRPDAFYLQAQLAIEAIWGDIEKYAGQIAEAVDLPPASLRLEYGDAPSGISIVVKNAPLIARARKRRPIYQRAETCLARVICGVYGAFHGVPALLAAARTLELVLSWPEPRIPIPGPERDESDAWEVNLGIKSRVMVIQERYGLTREQALEHLKQVAEDERAATAILPQPEPAPPSRAGADGQAEGRDGDPSADGPGGDGEDDDE